MNLFPVIIDGNAIIYCKGAFNTTNGKTAHGLIRFTERYKILSLVDSRYAGKDAGEVLDGKKNGIPVFEDILSAYKSSLKTHSQASHLVIGLAPDGGRLPTEAREDIRKAIKLGMNVDCGLHDYLNNDMALVSLAKQHKVTLRDIRKPKSIDQLHFFTGKIEQVKSLKVALLGTDSAVGKRTTAWILIKALRQKGFYAQMIGTGQTAWLQGAKYSIIMDSLVNDFVSGEIEHAVYSAWAETNPDVIIIEGQGSLLNPAYPGGFEILAAGRPDILILQHAPARKDYDGFPGYPVHQLEKQIEAVELISGKPVVAITINHENLKPEDINTVCKNISRETGLPAIDVLTQDPSILAGTVMKYSQNK
jgi:uncharacterized NAD-dependent epimerase/dehydratase family protein